MPARRMLWVLTLVGALACEGTLRTDVPDGAITDARIDDPERDAGRIDAGPTRTDAGPMPSDAGPRTPGVLAPDLRLTHVDLFQSVRVPIARDGVDTDRTGLPVVAAREALVRVHAEPLAGWRARSITAVLEITPESAPTMRFVDTRTPVLPATDDPTSGFVIRVPAGAMLPGAHIRVRLEAEGGVASAPDATYPRDGSSAALDVVVTSPIVLVLVPFRYDTDGSGRLPDTSDAQLAAYREELSSRFPYSASDVRVHSVVPWSRSTRIGGNVDWGDVNAALLELRDGAAGHEYWYGLMAPNVSRAAYCDAVWGSCVTGQSYVATLYGSRVGSGVGFGEADSVATLAHELGHLHGRYHAPCGTTGTDTDYPYRGGVIGTWGWDRRDGTFHSPEGSTDLLGYCDPQWVSDYTYRALFERQRDLRVAFPIRAEAASPHRILHVEEGRARWASSRTLSALPGEPTRATLRDAHGNVLITLEVSVLELAHGDARTIVLPDRLPARAAILELADARVVLP